MIHGEKRSKQFNRLAIVLALGAVGAAAGPSRAQLFQQKFTASDGVEFDLVGGSVSISGDTAVVGASGNDNAGDASGSAYVFVLISGIWLQEAKLRASDAAQGHTFGRSVSISGDTIVVGVTGDDDGGSSSGSAYVFVKPAGGWANMHETAKLTALDAAATDQFGISVSIDNDTAVVGAYFDDDAGESSGSAYVFVKPPGGWVNMTSTAKLTASDAASTDEFGFSVSISGDTAVVGAHRDDDACPMNTACDSGSAHVFVKPAGGWMDMTETAKLSASNPAQGDRFGDSVSISGDTAAIGAPTAPFVGGVNEGAYVFVRPAGGWTDMTQTARLTASDAANGDRFGSSVSITGAMAIVGASLDDDACPTDATCNSGSAYVFFKPAGGWADTAETVKLTAPDSAAGHLFGNSVSISGDTAVIGAPGPFFSLTIMTPGSAYVFRSDRDSDGVADDDDDCPGDPNKTVPGLCGCGTTDVDADGDGTPDCNDNCPATANADQADGNGNGVGDVCEPPPPPTPPPPPPPPPAAAPTEECGCGSGMDGMIVTMILPLAMIRRRWRRPESGRRAGGAS